LLKFVNEDSRVSVPYVWHPQLSTISFLNLGPLS